MSQGRYGTHYRVARWTVKSRWLSAQLQLLLAVCLACHGITSYAQPKAEEYHLKAAFLFHFAELVDWPPEAFGLDMQPMVLCTLGGDPFHGDLEAAVEGKLIGTRPLRVRHLSQPQELQGCNLLFIGSGDHTRLPLLLARLKSAPVLTVGETEDFTKQGGMIGLSVEDKKVRLDINLDASRRVGLKISSRLLLLAKSVIGGRV